MATQIPVTAHAPRGGQIQSNEVLRAWAEQSPGDVTFIGLSAGDQLSSQNLPDGAQLAVRGGKGGHVGRVTITKGSGFRVSK